MIKIKGLEEITNKFADINDFQKWAREPMTKTMYVLHDAIAKYPPKAAGAFSAMATPKQKRAYWAKVSSGEISHGANGYKRTETTGRKWTTEIQTTSNAVRGVLGNNASHTIYVQSQADIQPFHRASGWPTDKSIIDDNGDKIESYWAREIDKVLNK